MSVVIIGGNERMVYIYEDICKDYGYSAKIFVKVKGALKNKIGRPDLLILFTNTVSHRMVNGALEEARRNNIPIAWVHSSSASALHKTLLSHCEAI